MMMKLLAVLPLVMLHGIQGGPAGSVRYYMQSAYRALSDLLCKNVDAVILMDTSQSITTDVYSQARQKL